MTGISEETLAHYETQRLADPHHAVKMLAREVRRLQKENERLRKSEAALQASLSEALNSGYGSSLP